MPDRGKGNKENKSPCLLFNQMTNLLSVHDNNLHKVDCIYQQKDCHLLLEPLNYEMNNYSMNIAERSSNEVYVYMFGAFNYKFSTNSGFQSSPSLLDGDTGGCGEISQGLHRQIIPEPALKVTLAQSDQLLIPRNNPCPFYYFLLHAVPSVVVHLKCISVWLPIN